MIETKLHCSVTDGCTLSWCPPSRNRRLPWCETTCLCLFLLHLVCPDLPILLVCVQCLPMHSLFFSTGYEAPLLLPCPCLPPFAHVFIAFPTHLLLVRNKVALEIEIEIEIEIEMEKEMEIDIEIEMETLIFVSLEPWMRSHESSANR